MSDGEGDAEQATLRKTRDVSDQPGSGGKLPSRAPQETRDSGSRRRGRGAPGQGREPAVCTLQGAPARTRCDSPLRSAPHVPSPAPL